MLLITRLRRVWSWLVDQRSRSVNFGAYSLGRDVEGAHNVVWGGANGVARGVTFSSRVVLGYGSTIGANSMLVGPVEIGRYTQLGPSVGIYAQDHPTGLLSTYINRALLDGELKRFVDRVPVQIGNDVWVGHGAVLLKGVKIGTGAIIGAGAVVTTDIPPYAIAVGVPARIKGYRFDPELVQALLDSRWWELSPTELSRWRELLTMPLSEDRDRALSALRQFALTRRKPQGTI
jgi:virginiamycin A acetyltransferase